MAVVPYEATTKKKLLSRASVEMSDLIVWKFWTRSIDIFVLAIVWGPRGAPTQGTTFSLYQCLRSSDTVTSLLFLFAISYLPPCPVLIKRDYTRKLSKSEDRDERDRGCIPFLFLTDLPRCYKSWWSLLCLSLHQSPFPLLFHFQNSTYVYVQLLRVDAFFLWLLANSTYSARWGFTDWQTTSCNIFSFFLTNNCKVSGKEDCGWRSHALCVCPHAPSPTSSPSCGRSSRRNE